MPNQNEKDPLNPSQQDFDETVANPNTEHDSSGDAVAHDLSRSEQGLGPVHKRLQRRDNKQLAAREAEAAEWNDPENRFYRPSDKAKRGIASVSNWSNRKKGAAAAGIGGGIAALVLGFFVLLPLKIPGIMAMIGNEAGQRVEQVTERRAKIIIARAILTKMGSDIIVTGNGPVASLIASLRTNGFEKRLAEKGLTIERSGDGVKLRMNNELIGDGRTLRSDVDVLRAIEGQNLSNRMLNDVIKEEIPSWRWMKKAKFAKWLRIKYGIPRYGIENSKETDEEARDEEMNKNRYSTAYRSLSRAIGSAVDCMMNSDTCKLDPYATELDGISDDGTRSSNFIGDEADAATDETIDTNSSSDSGSSKTLTSTMLKNIGGKVIPGVNIIDNLATLESLLYQVSENDILAKIATYYRAAMYAQHYANWAGYGSQIELGAMNPGFIGVLATQTEGIEESQAFNMLQGNPERGVPVENKIDANGDRTELSKKVSGILGIFGGYDSLAGRGVHAIFDLWRKAANRVFEVLANAILFISPDALTKWLNGLLMQVLEPMLKLLGLDFDPSVKGAAMFNAAHGGATWTYNDFCRTELGCRKLTPAQTVSANSKIAAERAEYANQQGLTYKLFNTESSNSVVTRLAVSTPTNAATLSSSIVSTVANTPSQLLSLVTGKASASKYTDIHGVDPYGGLPKDLNQPLNEKAITGESCEDTHDGSDFDSCRSDKQTAEAMLCGSEPETEGCTDDPQPTELSTETDFTVASYNIQHKRFRGNFVERTQKQVEIIQGEAPNLNNPQFDIIGTQETSADQFNLLKKSLVGYDSFPKENNVNDRDMQAGSGGNGSLGILWNTTKFRMVESGFTPALSNINQPITAPWVGLKTNAGQIVYVISVHYAIADNGGTPENIRTASQLTMNWVREKINGKNNAIAVIAGDFNDRLSERNSYCVYTSSSLTQHAVDMEAKASADAGCNKFRYSGIDHIYATPRADLSIKRWTSMASSPFLTAASDHEPVYAVYSFPDLGDGKVDGTWVWPLKRDLKPGPCWGVSVGELGIHAGMDINSDIVNNPVYAMHSGTIIKTGYGPYEGNYIKVKTPEGFFYTYQHLSSISKTSGEIKTDEEIAKAGKTGRVFISSAVHLHVVVSKADDFPSYNNLQASIDPLKVLPAQAPGGYTCTK